MDKRTVSIINEGGTTEIQWGDREPVDGKIQGFVQIDSRGNLIVPFRDEATDESFVFTLTTQGASIHSSEDHEANPLGPRLWNSVEAATQLPS